MKPLSFSNFSKTIKAIDSFRFFIPFSKGIIFKSFENELKSRNIIDLVLQWNNYDTPEMELARVVLEIIKKIGTFNCLSFSPYDEFRVLISDDFDGLTCIEFVRLLDKDTGINFSDELVLAISNGLTFGEVITRLVPIPDLEGERPREPHEEARLID